jgi:hypothetical protein
MDLQTWYPVARGLAKRHPETYRSVGGDVLAREPQKARQPFGGFGLFALGIDVGSAETKTGL